MTAQDEIASKARTRRMWSSISGYAVGCCALTAAGYSLFHPSEHHAVAAAFFLVAIIAFQIDRVVEVTVLGSSLKLRALEEKQEQISEVVKAIEKSGGPGAPSAFIANPMAVAGAGEAADAAPPNPPSQRSARGDDWDDDPNLNRFGSSPERDGYRLSAKIKPLRGPAGALCEIAFEVRPITKDAKPEGSVRVYLHPSFGRYAEYDLNIVDGVARDVVKSVGVFTIGVQTASGTRLELNLADVDGGTEAFYKN
jgi:hypothetical protein